LRITKNAHPKGLYVLFFTEMWERFSFYGMRALLVLYMTKYLLLEIEKGKTVVGFETLKTLLEFVYGPLGNQAISSHIYGYYTGLVYLTPFFGGLLADRLIGQRRSVYIGGFLMAIGHFLMAIESQFFPALFFLIIGNGFFKPNISSQVGMLYAENDHRRDEAFTFFYMGINLGAVLSPLVCGTLGQILGWHWGFGSAGIGMLIGIAVYHFGKKHLPPDLRALRELHGNKSLAKETNKTEATSQDEFRSVLALIVLCTLNVLFWAVYEQQGNTMQLWADERTNFNLFGWFDMPTTWFQSFNPMMIILFAPLLMRFWVWQNARKKEPNSIAKMGIGTFLLGLGYIVMIVAAISIPEGEKGSLFWLIGATFIVTFGELYLSPIGLSLVTKMAPARMVSMLMGVWFLSSFLGNTLSGILGSFYETMGKSNFFTMLVAIAFVSAFLFFILNKPLQKLTRKEID